MTDLDARKDEALKVIDQILHSLDAVMIHAAAYYCRWCRGSRARLVSDGYGHLTEKGWVKCPSGQIWYGLDNPEVDPATYPFGPNPPVDPPPIGGAE